MVQNDHALQEVKAETQALNHAREFVEWVSREAAQRYQELLLSGRYDALLNDVGRFNHGQLYAFAEYQVFEEEFQRRFPDTGHTERVNAFCSLFMKNDISISNLLAAVEELDFD